VRTPLAALGLSLLCLAACGRTAQRPDVSWRSPPGSAPGARARADVPAEPRHQAVPRPAPSPPPSAAQGGALDRAAALSIASERHYAAGDLPAAIADAQQALEIREQALGPDHLDVASTLTSLAELYAVNEEYAAAEPLLRRALAIREAAFGPSQPLVAESLSNLGLLYAAWGRYGEAEPFYQRAIGLLERAPANAPQLAVVLDNYAALLADSGRPEGARALEARARALRDAPAPAAD